MKELRIKGCFDLNANGYYKLFAWEQSIFVSFRDWEIVFFQVSDKTILQIRRPPIRIVFPARQADSNLVAWNVMAVVYIWSELKLIVAERT